MVAIQDHLKRYVTDKLEADDPLWQNLEVTANMKLSALETGTTSCWCVA
jgi:hypothetical protein